MVPFGKKLLYNMRMHCTGAGQVQCQYTRPFHCSRNREVARQCLHSVWFLLHVEKDLDKGQDLTASLIPTDNLRRHRHGQKVQAEGESLFAVTFQALAICYKLAKGVRQNI